MHIELEQVLAHQENLCPSDCDSLQLLLAYSLVHAFAAEINKKVTAFTLICHSSI